MSDGLRLGGQHGASPALVFDDHTLSWDEVRDRARRMRPDGPQHVVVARRDEPTILSIFAAIDAGASTLLLSPRASPAVREAQKRRVQNHTPVARPLVYVFTSGSTGAPRAACLSRHAFIASAEASAARAPFGPGDRWLSSMPLSHVGGVSILTRALHAGGAVVVAPEGTWDAEEVVARMSRSGVTHASFVPTMLSRVVDAGLSPPASLRALLVGGAPCPPTLEARARAAGWPVLLTYGLTEACSQVATQAPGDPHDGALAGRVGRPLPGAEVRVVDGEIQVRGPMLFDGYVSEPDPFTVDGFFPTGDLGSVADDGTLFVSGRADDRIITGGENVHPATVESALAASPAVREVCVFGVDDDEWGQVVAAAVVADATAASLDDLAKERLAPHERPRRLFFVDALPRTPSGKVDRRAVVKVCAHGSGVER